MVTKNHLSLSTKYILILMVFGNNFRYLLHLQWYTIMYNLNHNWYQSIGNYVQRLLPRSDTCSYTPDSAICLVHELCALEHRKSTPLVTLDLHPAVVLMDHLASSIFLRWERSGTGMGHTIDGRNRNRSGI